jgi:hypothetical protein
VWREDALDGESSDAYEQIVSLDAKVSEFFKMVGDDDRETHQDIWKPRMLGLRQ